MTILLSWLCWGACQEEVCLDPRFLCNLTPPRLTVELPPKTVLEKTPRNGARVVPGNAGQAARRGQVVVKGMDEQIERGVLPYWNGEHPGVPQLCEAGVDGDPVRGGGSALVLSGLEKRPNT